MEYTRLLSLGKRGGDVRYIKDALVTLGYLDKCTHDLFGRDTKAAVVAFQQQKCDVSGQPLVVDGIVGIHTWCAIGLALTIAHVSLSTMEKNESAALVLPSNIGRTAQDAISAPLCLASPWRQRIVLDALSRAYDIEVPCAFPKSLYIRGGNLYNKDLSENVITLSRIASGAAKQPAFYDGGRREMMERAVKNNPYITGADCSGGIVGLLRKYGCVKNTFDATANRLASNAHSCAVESGALLPADWVWRNGHIGLYVGGGYVVEWMGGAYGCQLTKRTCRKGYDFVAKRMRSLSAWQACRRPKYLD